MTDTTRLIVAGSRSIQRTGIVQRALSDAPFDGPREIVSGGADGVDTDARRFAESHPAFEYTEFEPDWDEHGKAAGPIRNSQMADYGDALLAIWDGKSAGTRDMIDKALDDPMPVYVHLAEDHD